LRGGGKRKGLHTLSLVEFALHGRQPIANSH
jgi:hypothetical protein